MKNEKKPDQVIVVCEDLKARAAVLKLLETRGDIFWVARNGTPTDPRAINSDEKKAADKPHHLVLAVEKRSGGLVLGFGCWCSDPSEVDWAIAHAAPVILVGSGSSSGVAAVLPLLEACFGKPPNKMKIDLATLMEAGACAEGLEWVADTFGEEARVTREALAAAIPEDRSSWRLWLRDNVPE